jgi:hypothetical protein
VWAQGPEAGGKHVEAATKGVIWVSPGMEDIPATWTGSGASGAKRPAVGIHADTFDRLVRRPESALWLCCMHIYVLSASLSLPPLSVSPLSLSLSLSLSVCVCVCVCVHACVHACSCACARGPSLVPQLETARHRCAGEAGPCLVGTSEVPLEPGTLVLWYGSS